MAEVRRRRSGIARLAVAGLGVCTCVLLASIGAQEPVPPPPSVAEAAEPVVDVRVVGNAAVPLQKISPHIQTRAGRAFNPDVVEDDVRRLNKSRQFVSVTTSLQRVPEGVIVFYHVVERPTLRYVRYLGATLRPTTLAKQTGLKVGDSVDPYMVEEGRRKLEEYYQSKGHAKARITIVEGNKPGDRGAVYLIHEGPKQKIFDIEFEGNEIASDERLKTQIQSKTPTLYLFKGEVDLKKIDEDVKSLTAYYRSLGYFSAKIGREIEYGESNAWATLRFVISEGPRYTVRNVSVIGAKEFSPALLEGELQLKGGKHFDQAAMNRDLSGLQDRYGAVGFVFCNVQADPRFLEQPGELDLVYQIEEGDRYRVGRIDVRIEGDDPHTRINTVLNRIDLRPGDIVDVRKIRESERRLKASGLFMNNPAEGITPRITWEAPDLDGAVASNNDSTVRGQSPDDARPPVVYSTPDYAPAGERVVNLSVDGSLLSKPLVPPAWQRLPLPFQPVEVEASPMPQPNDASGFGNPFWNPRRWEQIETADRYFEESVAAQAFQSAIPESPHFSQYEVRNAAAPLYDPNFTAAAVEPALIVRGQSPWQPTPTLGGGATTYGQVPLGAVNPQASGGAAYPNTPNYAGGTGIVPAQYAPVAPYTSAPTTSSPYAATPPSYLSPAPTGTTGVAPFGSSQPTPLTAQGSPYTPPPLTSAPGYSSGNEIFGTPPQAGPYTPTEPYAPTRDLILTPTVQEAQTGRFMLGVGVNSNAGVVGSIVLDEQNGDLTRLPTSFRDVIEGRAFRGAGQQIRLEAVPGSQVSRYSFIFRQPYLFDTRVSFGASAYYFQRYYRDWKEDRTGGRLQLGYQFPFVPDLSVSSAIRFEHVDLSAPTFPTPPQLAAALGGSDLFVGEFSVVHDTRDSTFIATQGHRVMLGFDIGFGEYDFPRATVEGRQHFMLRERPDGSGRQVLTLLSQLGFTGSNTPIYENYFAGGFSSMRGFNFRGVGPVVQNVNVGGQFQWLNTIEYMFPMTADDMIRGVAFCDFGTVEQDIALRADNFRVAPGLGLRITVPAMGPAPIAIDFAVPVAHADGDNIQTVAFYLGMNR